MIFQCNNPFVFLSKEPKKSQMAVFKNRNLSLHSIFPSLYALSFILTSIYGIWDHTHKINQRKKKEKNMRHNNDVLVKVVRAKLTGVESNLSDQHKPKKKKTLTIKFLIMGHMSTTIPMGNGE